MARIKYNEAAGIEAKKGKPAIGNKPKKTELKKLYIKESRSIREAAEILGCSKDMVFRALKEYIIGRRKTLVPASLLEKNTVEQSLTEFNTSPIMTSKGLYFSHFF